MPITSFDQPNSFEFEDERDPLFSRRRRRESQPPEEDSFSPFQEIGKGFTAGLEQEKALLGGAVRAGIGSAIGDEEMKQAGFDYYRERLAEAEKYAPTSGWDDDWDSLSDVGNFVFYTLGNAIPTLATTVAGGGVTGFAAKAGTKKFAKESLEQEVDSAFDDVAKEIVDDAAKRRVANEYVEAVANKYGQRAAAFGTGATGAALGFGESFASIYEETGLESPVTALVTGIVSGTLDSFGAPFRAIKAAFPDRPEIIDNLKDHIAKDVLTTEGGKRFGHMLSEGVKAAGQEGVTEALQEFLVRSSVSFSSNFLNEEEQELFRGYLFNEEATSSYLHAAVAGSIAGSAFGGTVGAFKKVDGPDGETLDVENEENRQQNQVRAKKAVSKAAEAPIDVEPESETATDPTRVSDTLETIEISAGISRDELAKDNALTGEQQQEILDILIDQGRIKSEMSGDKILYTAVDDVDPQPTERPPEIEIVQPEELDLATRARMSAQLFGEFTVSDIQKDIREGFNPTLEAIQALAESGQVVSIGDGRYRFVEDAPAQPALTEKQQIRAAKFRKRLADAETPIDRINAAVSMITRGQTDNNPELIAEGEAALRAAEAEGFTIQEGTRQGDTRTYSEALAGLTRRVTFENASKEGDIETVKSVQKVGIIKDGRLVQIPEVTLSYSSPEATDADAVAEDTAAPKPVTPIDRSADVPEQVMALVETLDDFSIADVTRGTDLRRPEAKQALSQLETDGKIEVVKGGRYRVTSPDPQVQAELAKIRRDSFEQMESGEPIGLAGEVQSFIRGDQDTDDSLPARQERTIAGQNVVPTRFVVAGETSIDRPDDGRDIQQRISTLNRNVGVESEQPAGTDTLVTQQIPSIGELVRQLSGKGEAPRVKASNGLSGLIPLEPVLGSIVSGDMPVNDLLDLSPQVRRLLNSFVDIFERGMPSDAMTQGLNGVYVIDRKRTGIPRSALAINFNRDGSLGINPDFLSATAKDDVQAKKLISILSHEMWHQQDTTKKYSEYLPGLRVRVEQVADTDSYSLSMGDVVSEIFDQWEAGSELGEVFNYPFTYVQLLQKQKSGDFSAVSETLRREVFAQLGATYISNPGLLEQFAPKAYRLMRDIQRDPRSLDDIFQEARDRARDADTAVQETDTTGERAGVSGEVRAPPGTGGIQVPDDGGAGVAGSASDQGQQAGGGLGDALTEPSRDESGRLLEVGDTVDFMRVPSTDEVAPVLPMGKVEESLQSLLQETGNNPTPEQLAAIVGSPSPRKGKEELDRDVKPRTLEELRGFMRQSIAESDGLQWYDQFGRFFRDLVGDANLDEASVVFGVTSAQNSAEQNLADTLHVMSIARRVDPIETPKQFELALRSTPRPGGQRLKITGDQIKRIIQLYRDGSLEGGIKTTTYMQMVADRGRNLFNPFSVQDVHMARVFGFNKKEKDPKSGNEVDAANIGPENSYRYAQFLTSHLADEFNVSPNQAQALLWFYAKSNLSPAKAGKPGTFESAEADSDAEIQVIRDMIQSGEFATDTALTPALAEGMRPSNKPAQKTTPFSNVAEREELLELARQRSPKVIASAIPGKDRGYGFPDDTPIETLVEYNNAVVEAITDSEGQIPLLRDLGIPHEIETGSGSFTGYEPAISIRLIGGTLEQANEIGPVLGDALLQDAVITAQPVFREEGMPAFLIEKNDGSDFSMEDGMALTDRLNPEKDPGGINFNQPLSNGLVFIDPKVFDDSITYTAADAEEFYGILQSVLGDDYSIGPITQDGAYFDHSEYEGSRAKVRGQAGLGGSSDLQDAARGGLYEPVQRVYKEYAEKLGVQTEGLTFPSFTDPDTQGDDSQSMDFMLYDDDQQKIAPFKLLDDVTTDVSLANRYKTKTQNVRQKVVDRLERLKQAEDEIANRLGLDRLPSEISAYDAENLMHSKAQKQLEDFEVEYVETIGEAIKGSGLSMDQVGLYLLAKHAPERNRVIAQKEQEQRAAQIAKLEEQIESATEADEPTGALEQRLNKLQEAPFRFQDTGSGMTDADAQTVLDKAESDGMTDTLEGIAERVYSMLDDMRQNMVDKGLLDEETRADWQDTYEFYVPLKGFASYPEGLEMRSGVGAAGFSVKGSESFKAKGRVTLPVNPLLVSFKDAEEKIIRAERNVIAQRLLALLQQNESEDNWQVFNNRFRPDDPANPSEKLSLARMKTERRVDDGLLKYIQVKRGGQTFFIEVKDRELNRQLQSSGVGMFNNNVDFMNKVLTELTKFQNFRRNMLINYNPSWGLVNPLRDIQTGLAFALSEEDTVGGRIQGQELIGKISSGYGKSLRAFWRSRRGSEGANDTDREYDQYVKEYVEDGAPTGLSLTKSLAEQSRRFEKVLTQGDLRKKVRYMTDLVEDYNQTMENAVRLSTYVEARKSGTARADAATLAKDLTVNFNRKGEYSSAIDSLYLFFNAAVQGNVNIAKAILRPGSDGQTITKARLVAGSMVAWGFTRTLMNMDFGGEDDDGELNYADFNEYALKTSMVLINPFSETQQAYAMPMPYGYGIFDNIGRYGAELAMGVKTPQEIAVDLTSSVDHHFNPLSLHAAKDNAGLVEAAVQKGIGLTPDIVEVFAEQLGNINFFGSDITIPQNSFLVEKPPSEPTKRGTSEYITAVTRFVNQATDGNDDVTGYASFSPERIQHLLEFAFGGVGRFFDDSADTVAKLISEEPDLRSTDLPILRTFMPLPSEYSDRIDFYQNRDSFRQHEKSFKSQTTREGRREVIDDRGYNIPQFAAFDQKIEKFLRKLRDQKNRLENNELIDPLKRYEAIERIAQQEELLYDEYNKRWRKEAQ